MKASRKGFDRPRSLWVVTAVVLALLYLPLAIVLLYSLNSSNSLTNFTGTSLRWYHTLANDQGMLSSLWLSVEIALIATVSSVVLGTALAFGMQRGSHLLSRPVGGAVFLRIVTPETATGVALLLLFTQLGIQLSTTTIIISHIALCIAFVTVIVRSRLALLNEELEDSAMDLGATRLRAVWLVAIPALRPAIVAAALLSFVLSFDDFITSFFTSGIGVPPLPVRIYGLLRQGVTPEVNAVGVAMLVVTVLAIAVAVLALRWLNRQTVYRDGEATRVGR